MLALDDVLARFQQGALEYLGGLANHGPMAAEALVALGHPALLDGWVDVYAPRLPPLEIGTALPPAQQREARGRIERAPDWVATELAALEAQGFEARLRDVLPSLVDGLFASAFHGWLRVAHALRAIGREDTAVRRREVAFGLALWQARYQEIPGSIAQPAAGSLDVAAALRAVPRLPEARRKPGFFMNAVAALEGEPEFAAWASSLAAPDDPEQAITVLCREAARLYLAHPAARIAYVHALTAPAAWRMLQPFLAPEDAARAALRLLQAVGALHAVSEPAPGAKAVLSPEAQAWSIGEQIDPAEAAARMADDEPEIRYRAACSIEEHAIKMAEACLRENARSPDPSLRLAAADAALHIS